MRYKGNIVPDILFPPGSKENNRDEYFLVKFDDILQAQCENILYGLFELPEYSETFPRLEEFKDPNLNSYFCASNKLYELMDSGTLVLTNDTVGASRVVKPENGICIETVTVENIRKGLSYLSTCQNAPRMNYYWESQEEVLKDIYK